MSENPFEDGLPDMPKEMIRNEYVEMLHKHDKSMMRSLKKRLVKTMPEDTPPIIYMLMAVSMDKFGAIMLVNEDVKQIALIENENNAIDIRRLLDE